MSDWTLAEEEVAASTALAVLLVAIAVAWRRWIRCYR